MCFTGHRFIAAAESLALRESVRETVRRLYGRGFRRFYSGGALGFDLLAAEEVLLLRQTLPDLRLLFVLPCADQTESWKEDEVIRQRQLITLADETRVLSPHYYQGCMMVRNRYMVDHASQCVCYLKHMRGGTMSTVAYALHQDVPVINLAMRGKARAEQKTAE